MNVTFLKHSMFSTSRFWNIPYFKRHISETFHILNVTFLKHIVFWTFLTHFMFWMLHFWKISVIELWPSKTFYLLNFRSLRHYIFWTSYFWNISSFELHFPETLSGHLTLFCRARSHFYNSCNYPELSPFRPFSIVFIHRH